MVLRKREDIVFYLTGDENIIEYDLSYVCNLVFMFSDEEYELEEMVIPYNFILGMIILTGAKLTTFNGQEFMSVYHIDEYIRESPNTVQLMIDFIVIFR
jgi:hypothetical protein